VSIPSTAALAYAGVYLCAILGVAIVHCQRRDG